MKRKRNGMSRLILAAALCVLCTLCLGACGEEAGAETQPVAARSSQELETMPETDQGQQEEPDQETQQNQQPRAEQEPEADSGQEVGGESGQEPGGESGQAPSDSVEEPSDRVEETLDVTIEEVKEASFLAAEVHTESDGDALMAVQEAVAKKEDLIEIVYDDRTAFTVRSSDDGGISCTDAAGSGADLEAGRSAILKGVWDGDIFRASEIMIYHFS